MSELTDKQLDKATLEHVLNLTAKIAGEAGDIVDAGVDPDTGERLDHESEIYNDGISEGAGRVCYEIRKLLGRG